MDFPESERTDPVVCGLVEALTQRELDLLTAVEARDGPPPREVECGIQQGHDGPHHGFALEELAPPAEWWLSWAGRQPRDLRVHDPCPATVDDLSQQPCLLFAGHPGLHSFDLEGAEPPDPDPGPRAFGLPPGVAHRPGLADELWQELTPLVEAQGIPTGGGHVTDIASLQAALDSAVEQRNMVLFSPVGQARENAAHLLHRFIDAVVADDRAAAALVLDHAVPESPDDREPKVAACIGVAVGLLDDWLSGHSSEASIGLRPQLCLPTGGWPARQAGLEILAVAAKGRAFRSLTKMIARHGGHTILHGSALALAATVLAWSQQTEVPATQLARTHIA